jgi:Pumilio-family RNA binding repeat
LDSQPGPARAHLVSRIVNKSLELMQDAYGNYVVQYVLDVCSDEDVHAVCESVVGKVNLLAIQKFSSNVMEKCLERCTDRVKEQYLHELSDTDRVRELMMDPFGNYVIQRALSVATP